MTREDKEEIERLLALNNATITDKKSALTLVQRYISPGFSICITCDPMVRNLFNKLRKWWDAQNKSAYNFIKTIN